MDENREEEDCYDELEACLLINSASHEPIFQRIFEKYDREFPTTERGGKILSFSHEAKFEAQLKQLFVPAVSKWELDESEARSSSSSSDEGGLSESEVESSRVFPALVTWTKNSPTAILDPVVTERLHRKVVEIKKEIDWDNEEKRHWEMLQERKALADPISSDEEDFKPHAHFSHVPTVPLHEDSSGMESGYLADYVALDHSRGYEYADCPSGLESGFAVEHSESEDLSGFESGLVEEDLSGFESGLVEEDGTLPHHSISNQHRKRRRVTDQTTMSKKRKLCPGL